MKAVYINETGSADVLTYGDRPDPEIAPGEILHSGRRQRAESPGHELAGRQRPAFPARPWAATLPARWRKSAPTPARI